MAIYWVEVMARMSNYIPIKLFIRGKVSRVRNITLPGILFTKKTQFYRRSNPHYKPKTVWRPSRVYNGNPYTNKRVYFSVSRPELYYSFKASSNGNISALLEFILSYCVTIVPKWPINDKPANGKISSMLVFIWRQMVWSHHICTVAVNDASFKINKKVPWWRHQMETFSALLALCAGNSSSPVNSPHKGQWRRALMFSLICTWINHWVNTREAGGLRRHLRSLWRHCNIIRKSASISVPIWLRHLHSRE